MLFRRPRASDRPHRRYNYRDYGNGGGRSISGGSSVPLRPNCCSQRTRNAALIGDDMSPATRKRAPQVNMIRVGRHLPIGQSNSLRTARQTARRGPKLTDGSKSGQAIRSINLSEG